MRQLTPLAVGLAVGAAITLSVRTNLGLCVGIFAFWIVTAITNKLLRSPS
jgi:hypothetical protein